MVILLLLSGIPYNPELPKETEISHTGGMILDAVMVKDIYSGNISSSPTLLTAIGNTLYFAATTASTGNELWKSDGTTSGTMMVKDINSGSSSGSLGVLTAVGNTLYFTANDGFSGRELWKSDGTTSGTMMVKDIHSGASGSSPNHFAVMGSTLYFQANDGINGHELWKSDGTTSGTIMVKDINNGSVDSSPTELTVVGSTLFFSAKDSVGRELWKSDGTASGTVMVKNIWTGSAGPGDGDPKEMTSIGNTLYFQAASWDIDGDGYFDGVELWKSDGTTSGTVRVKDINNNTNGSSTPSDLVVIDYGALEILFFRASDGTNGGELWKSDGTTAGTVMVKDIYSGSSSGSADHLTAVGNTLYFKASDGTNGAELWKSDGTTAGTVMVKDINSGGASIPQHLTAVGNTLFFQAIDGTNGNELWKSDGTTAGTVMVKDINSGGASYPNQLTAVGNTLFFQATEGTNGNELWKTFEAPEDAATATAEAGIHHSGSQVAVITNLTGVTPGWDYTVDWSLYYSSNGTEIFSFNQPYSYFINSTTFDTGWSYFNADDLVVGVDICLEVSVYNGTTASSTNALGSDSKCMQLPDWINFMKNSGNGVGGSVGNSIAFDSNDNAHISYYDDSSSSHWLKYTGYIGTDGSGNPTSWTNMIVDSSVDEVGLYSSIGVDSNDKVHISYYDATNQCLKYAHRSIAAGGEWSASTIDCSNDVGMFNSLVIDSSDAVHIAYFDATDSELKYAYNDGTGWSTNTIATGNVGHWISIAVDPWDNVHIAYRHLGDLSLMYVTIGAAGNWNSQVVDNTTADVGKHTSIAVDGAGSVYISYYDHTNQDLKVATRGTTQSAWYITTLDSADDVGKFSSISAVGDGEVHISYYDSTNQDLKYLVAANDGSAVISTIDSEGGVGKYTSLALDSNDKPHIIYYESTPNAEGLKFACRGCSVTNETSGPALGMAAWYNSAEQIHMSPFTLAGISTTENYNVNMILTYESNGTIIDNQWENISCACTSYSPAQGLNWNLRSIYNGNEILDNTTYVLWANVYSSAGTITTQSNTIIVYVPPSSNDPSLSVNLGYSSQINKLQVVYVLSNLDASNTYILERALFFQLNSTSIVGDSITVDCNCNSDTGSVSWEEGAIYAPHIITDDTDYCVEVILKNSAGTVLDQIVSCANFPQTDDGLSWLISTIPDATGGYGEFVDMALDSQETPHFCYYDSGNSDLKYAMFDGSSWVVTHVDGDANAQTTGAIDGDIGKYCSIAFDSNNMPHISYYDATNGNLRFAAFDGNGWTSEIVDDFGDVGTDTSLAISSNGTPHISYYGEGSNDTIVLYYTYKINNSWGLQALDDVGDLQHSPTGAQTSIVLTNDFASISYYDAVDGDLEFFWEDDDSWYWKTIDSDGLVGSFSSHIVDGDGRPHISYYDETNGALKYAAYDGLADWSNTTLDDEGDAGLYTSLAFNDDGFVSISYFDSSNGSLKYIVLEPNQWNEYTIDTVGRIGEYSSLAIDSTGEIYVAYYDNTAAVLKLACNTCNFTDSGGSSGGSDGDNDGVEDSMDDCPDGDSGWTSDPLTTDYDQDGCRDATEDDDDDNDGIDDGDDSCYQGMTGWWSWDEDPVVDFDHDGCLDTGEDDDDDNDGRGDTSDTCLETRLGAVVDTEGCESSFPDDDGDGVSNSYDDCPNTTAGVGVDDFDGCPEGDDGSGVTWSNLIIDSAGDVGQYSSIAIDSNDNLHISYFDMNNGALKYATYDGSSWTTTTVDMGDVGLYSSIAIDSNNNIHISYYDSTNSALKYATYDGSSWTISTVDNLGTLGTHTSIAVDSSDNLHISYRNDTGVALKYATYDGSLWTTSTVDSTGNVGKYSSIAVDSNDNLHISYFDDTNDDLKYATYDGSTWTNSTVDSAGDVGYDTSIAVDSNDNLYISYLDLANVDLKSATYDGSSWTVSTVDSVGDGLVHSSIAVDSNDDIHISYHAGVTNWILKYATYDGSSWTTSTIDNNIGNVGQYSSIAVDSNDDIHISYFDSVNDVLKYATTSASGGSSGGSGDGNGTGVDSDGDGVSDDDDDCPNNAANPPTDGDYDGDGCPDSMDNDKDDDDVFDINDNCIYSPLGWSTLDEDPIVDWDHDGCLDDSEDLDVDGDGVSNGVDECAYTLIGGTVDDVGCLSSEDEVVDDIESDEDPEDEWYSNIPVIGSQIDPLVEMVQTKYGKAISASVFVLTALGYAYRVVTVRSEMKMKKRMNKFEKRIDNASSEKGLRKIERDVEIDEEKNNLPLGGYGDLMSMIENREEDLGIGEGSKSEQMMSMASGMQAEMADSMQAMRETQEDIASMADSMRDAHPQQRGGPQGMAASPRPMQTSSGLNRPSYHPKDMDEDGFVSDEDLAKFNSLSKAEQIARQSRASDDKGLTGEIVRFSKLPRSSKARCYCGSNKQFGKCHLGKEKCPCNSGKKFLKCCAKKRNFR
jgi:ELWxxDGT repeat protein